MLKLRFVIWLLSVSAMITGAGGVSCQDYPRKPIRIITVPIGGGADVVARLLAQGIAGALGQPIIIDNRPASFTGETLAKATPDGYSLLIEGQSVWMGTLLQKKTYDPVRDFSPITLMETFPFLLVVNTTVPVKSVAELITLAKARPGTLNYGSGATGAGNHLGAELFKVLAGVNIVRIPYTSAQGVVNGVLGGEVQMAFLSPGTAMPQVKSSKLRALAVTTTQPTPLVADLPTVAASGLPGYELVSSTGMFAPAGTPVAIINRLNQETVRVLGRTEVKERFLNTGSEAVGNSAAQFGAFLKSELSKWSNVLKSAGIKTE